MTKILSYIKVNKLFSFFWGYMVISLVFKTYSQIDFTIPCLFYCVWGIKCPGCGLTTACGAMAQLNFVEAYHHNPLVFVIVPSILFYFINDFYKFSYQLKH